MRFVQVAKWLELPSAKAIFFKLSFIETFLYRSFAKTGSGQAHGKLKTRLSLPHRSGRSFGWNTCALPQPGWKTRLFAPVYARNHHFTETCSGQTYGKHSKNPSVGLLSRNQRLLGNALVQEDDLDKHINAQGLSPGCEICIF